MRKLFIGTIVSFFMVQLSFAGCLETYNSDEIKELMNKKSTLKENVNLALRYASVSTIPVGVGITCIATMPVVVAVTVGSLFTFGATMAASVNFADSDYLNPKKMSVEASTSSLEQAHYVINWAYTYGTKKFDYLGPYFLSKEIGKRADSLIEPDLQKYVDSIREEPKSIIKILVKEWLTEHAQEYVVAATVEIRNKILVASERDEFCPANEIPANLRKIKKHLKL